MLSRRHRKSFQDQHDEDFGKPLFKIEEYPPKDLSEKLSFLLIRPPRFTYNQQLLVPPITKNGFLSYEEHQIPFKLSLYKAKEMKYVVLYLHGNGASRYEGHGLVKDLPKGVGLACFDFSACGNRKDSEFVTLGEKESKEVDIAARYLKGLGYEVAGWGRSMGAASLLLSTELEVLVVDSPYNSLSKLCKQSSKKQVPAICCCFFECLYPCIFGWLKSVVHEKSGMEIGKMQISERVNSNPINKQRKVFFMTGEQDELVSYENTKTIYKQFPGIKKIRVFQGTHNSARPRHLIQECFEFISHHLIENNPQAMQILSPRRKLSKIGSSPRLMKLKSQRKPMKTQAAEIFVQNTETRLDCNDNKNDDTAEIMKVNHCSDEKVEEIEETDLPDIKVSPPLPEIVDHDKARKSENDHKITDKPITLRQIVIEDLSEAM